MEVSRQSDSVTHAVLGKQESVQMGVSNSATLMHVLSTALYTHPQLAAVREIICNGWDGHIVAGNTATPLQITIDEQFIRVRDFGPGIPHEKIGEIYGTYGNSTKRHDGQQTGGFGLGSKAPFAYTDNFEVINHHGGQKIIYRVSKSSMAAGGSPTIDTIVKLPSDETGIQVSMNIKSHYDKIKFMEIVNEICLLGEIEAKINDGMTLPVLPLSESPTGYIICSANGTNLQRINVRYGNVVYPIPELEAFEDVWGQVTASLMALWGGAKVIFMAQPDTITIAPSREALIYTPETTATIKALLAKFNPQAAKSSPNTARQVTMTQVNKKIPLERKVTPEELKETMMLTAQQGTSQTIAGGPFNYDARKAAVSYAISRRSLSVQGDKLILKRMKNSIHHELVDKTKGKAFLRAASIYHQFRSGKMSESQKAGMVADSYLSKALHKHHTWPLMQELKANDKIIDLQRFFFIDQPYYHSDGKLVSPWKISIGDIASLWGWLRPRVLLARSKKAIADFLQERRYKGDRDLAGWMVYQLPNSEKDYHLIEDLFKAMDFQVHTYLPVTLRAERAKPSDDPNWVPAAKKPVVKRKGYLTLESSRSYDHQFTLTKARETCKPDDHVTDPIAYVILNAASDYAKKRFTTIQDAETCRKICDVFGKQIAVITSTQIEKLEKLGVPELSKFIYQHVDDTLAAAKDFPRYLAFGRHIVTDDNRPFGAEGILQGITQHHDLAATLPGKPFRYCVSAETLALSKLFSDRHFRAIGTPKCDELAKKVSMSKDVKVLKEQINCSPWATYVNLDAIAKVLHKKAPNDASLKVPYEIVTHLMTPMETQQ